MFEAVRRGEIRLLWIACTNPAQSMPDQTLVREALERAELVVLQEAFATTETAAYADVLLPATTWGEKEGTVTNSERRITRVRAAIGAPAKRGMTGTSRSASRASWKHGCGRARRRSFPYEGPEAIFNEHRAATAGRDLDMTGISYALLDTQGPQQWPFRAGATSGAARLYGRRRLSHAEWPRAFCEHALRARRGASDRAPSVPPEHRRLRDQWHGMSRTGRSARLFGNAPEPRVTMNPADLGRRLIAAGDLVRIASSRGAVTVAVEASDEVRPGQVFLPMHWGSAHLGGAGAHGINALTSPAFDPVSRQPELKHCAVRITKAELPWRLVAFGYPLDGDAVALAEAARRWLGSFPFATCVLVGGERSGVLFRAAAPTPGDRSVIAALDALFGLDDHRTLSYEDARRGVGRRVRVHEARIEAVRLAGDLAAEPWLRELFDSAGAGDEPRAAAPRPRGARAERHLARAHRVRVLERERARDLQRRGGGERR